MTSMIRLIGGAGGDAYLSPNGFEDIVHTGLHGWDISPSTDDGMDALKAATQLALKNPSTHAQSTRDVIREWEALRGTENDELAKQMLLPLYQEVGDKQAAEALQQ